MQADPGRRKALAFAAGLAALTLVAYSRVAANGFIDLDDNDYVTQNPHVQAGFSWKGLAWALTSGHSANWHPLTWLSHMLDWQLYGLDPAGHHRTNLVIHAASVVSLFHLFRRMTSALWPSAFVAAVFALHPLHVESVAWVAERKDVLSTFLWILTTLAYVRWVERRSARRYAAVLALYALGLTAKPMLVTLPFTLLLLDWWPLRRIETPWRDAPGLARLAREKVPLFALAAASCAVTFAVQRAAGAMSLGDQISPGLRAANASVSYAAYLAKSLWPAGLAVYYPHPVEAPPIAEVGGSLLLLAAITALALRNSRARPWLAVGWLWFVGTLVPVIGLVQVGSAAMADRYTYVPLIGLSAAVAFGAVELAQHASAVRPVLAIAFAAVVAIWTGLTWRQVGFWKDDRTLFGHVADVMPENYLAHGILGNVHLREGRLEEALAEYREALRLRPSYAQGHSNVGMALELSGRKEEAIGRYREALRWSPDLPEAHHNLARLLASEGRTQEAIEHFEAALRSKPDLVEAHNNLGTVLMGLGRIEEAAAHFGRALELRPGFPEARANLARAQALLARRPGGGART